MLCYLRQSFSSEVVVQGVDKAVGNIDTVALAHRTDRRFGDFLTNVNLKSTHTCPKLWCGERDRRISTGFIPLDILQS